LVLLSRKEKEKLDIHLANEDMTTREIAKIVHIPKRHWQDYSQGMGR
jgi:hypothetical protein